MNDLFSDQELNARLQNVRQPLHLFKNEDNGQLCYLLQQEYETYYDHLVNSSLSHVGILPPVYPEWLGEQSFLRAHGARFAYVVGEMANAIATPQMVVAAAKAGMVGFLGAAGLMPHNVEKHLLQIKSELTNDEINWGSNLIHSPTEPALEQAIIDLYLKHDIRRVSASAYMSINPAIVRYACQGLHVDAEGRIQRKFHVLAKISRPEVAKLFMSPAPNDILSHLLASGKITEEEAKLAAYVPIASDVTAEADSGGHTDNRPLSVLVPLILDLAQQLRQRHQYADAIRVGAAGGIGTPSAVNAAFSLGAAYVVTGSVNQSAIESGLSHLAKQMLAQADMADVAMAPAADMFELGVKLQVLKRSNFFVGRANKLYELYAQYNSLDEIPADIKNKIETEIFQTSLKDIWQSTIQFFNERDPAQIERAEKDPKHQMALIFRWYLGLSSQWAIRGDEQRKMDFQVWCGPAMGAFNQWVKNTFLEKLENRSVEQIGRNLLEGAAITQRMQQLRSYGFELKDAFCYQPKLLA